MGLRCSLLGHDFGEAELDRDREERGDEVVITIREVKTCGRCGDERVLSENTEVRPVEPIGEVESNGRADEGEETDAPSDGGGAVERTPDDGAADAGRDASAPGEGAGASADEDVEFIDADAEAESGESSAVDADSAGGGVDAGDAPTADAATDDGVIIDDDEEEETDAERPAGEWPDATDTRMDERDVPAAAGPEVEVESDGEDAEIIEGGPEEEAQPDDEPAAEQEPEAGQEPEADDEPESAASEWPDPKGEDRGFDAEPGGEQTDVEFSGLAPEGNSGAVATTPSESPSMAVDTETAFVCPECGFAKPATKASLRAGDICPECKKGYLKEQ